MQCQTALWYCLLRLHKSFLAVLLVLQCKDSCYKTDHVLVSAHESAWSHAQVSQCIAANTPSDRPATLAFLRTATRVSQLFSAEYHRLFQQQFVYVGGLKDVGFIQRLAEDCGVKMPMGELMLDNLKQAGDRGWTDLDWTAVSRIIREPAGIQED